MNWLIPRLRAFKRENPAIEVRLNINYGAVDFVRDEVSLAIRSSAYRAPEDVIVRPLQHEDIAPVCHPDYADRLELRTPEDLTRTRILGTATRPDAWSEWLTAIGRSNLTLEAQENYDHHYLLIQAACYGLGMAIAPRILVADEIERGHLVAPLGFVSGTRGLNLWIAPHVRSREDVRRLSGWIQDEMARHATAGADEGAEAANPAQPSRTMPEPRSHRTRRTAEDPGRT